MIVLIYYCTSDVFIKQNNFRNLLQCKNNINIPDNL